MAGSLIKFYALYNTTPEIYNTQCANAGALVFATLTDGTRRIYYNGDGNNKQEWIIPSDTEFEALKEALGDISELATETSASTVDAINELVGRVEILENQVSVLTDNVEALSAETEALSAETANKVASVTPSADTQGYTTIETGGTATAVTLNVKIDPDDDNKLQIGPNGLFVANSESDEYLLQQSGESGDFAAVYYLTKNGHQTGATINIPKDQFLEKAEIRTSGTTHPAENGPYLVLTWQIESGASGHSETWIAIKDFIAGATIVTRVSGDNTLINATTTSSTSAVTVSATNKLINAVSLAESSVQSVAISSASTNGGYVVVTETTASGSKDKSFTIGLTMVTGTTDTGLATDGYVQDAIDEAIENTVSAVTTGSDNLISASTSNRGVTISSTETLQSAVTKANSAVQSVDISSGSMYVSVTSGGTATALTFTIGLTVTGGTDNNALATDGYVQDAITEALADFNQYDAGNGIDITDSDTGDTKVISVQTKTDDYVTVGADGVRLDGDKITDTIASSGSTKLVEEQAVYNAFCWNVVTGI